MSQQDLPKNLICLHSGRSYKEGIVVLPREFLNEYADKLPEKVYLHEPSGGIWSGTFVKEAGIIEGLQHMISFYNLKQYNMPLLQYNGGPHFNLRIFNCYAVEIQYALGAIPSTNSKIPTEKLMNADEIDFKNSQLQLEKLATAFTFNAYYNTQNTWEVKLEKKHLQTKDFQQVLSTVGLTKLKIDQSMSHVHIGFVSCMWKIDLVKDNGYLTCSQGWTEFVNECNLSEGDVCIFQTTNQKNSLQVAIFNNKEISKWSPPNGDQLAKSRTLFLHISSKDSLQNGEIVLPRIFLEKFGTLIGNAVKLWMADRHVWIAAFSETDKCIFGLHRLQQFYSIQPETLMVFEYFGKSTFYLSIFGSNGVDLLYGLRNKLLVKDVVMDSHAQYNSEDDHSNVIANSSLALLVEENSENNMQSFSVLLSTSHFDQKSHGVYLPRTLISFYKKWNKRKNITLRYKQNLWKVKANAAGKQCRLGAGWSQFIDKTDFLVGQHITFKYIRTTDLLFEVTKTI